jgi:cobalt/nickel transport protein
MRLWAGFLILTLVVAGGLSYLSSSSPDGLDSATLRGCEVIEHNGTEQLTGQCIAQNAARHPLADSPLADYAVGGSEGSGGIAGIVGVAVTLTAAVLIFRVLSRARARETGRGD